MSLTEENELKYFGVCDQCALVSNAPVTALQFDSFMLVGRPVNIASGNWATMGTATKVLSVAGRILAFASAVIVCGISGSYVHRLDQWGIGHGSRIDYVLALSVIAIVFSLVLMPPLRYSFWAFPMDGIMFVMWMVAFGLLANLSTQCEGDWYFSMWTLSWRWSAGCGTWRALLAFTFISSLVWLMNAALGLYATCPWDNQTGRSKATLTSHTSHNSTGRVGSHEYVPQTMQQAPPPRHEEVA
ncbi:unnamed protein product [Parascedosporium putredinis]|uniref:MARVEL domain-containing protein n=1 Tax=Parascedosporium putredinis TaxID=1442378 RepID=A0A9P1M8C1_9PEZI|nr:unnamed protein product [Parascedosporium putredinis]CAI7989626.1 unnamed protein product [Parascedosporium putredinis]